MITPQDFMALKTAPEFKPFRVHLRDGTAVEIADRYNFLVSVRTILIGLKPDSNGIPTEELRCPISDVLQLEVLSV
jgi:hypothetical protein